MYHTPKNVLPKKRHILTIESLDATQSDQETRQCLRHNFLRQKRTASSNGSSILGFVGLSVRPSVRP